MNVGKALESYQFLTIPLKDKYLEQTVKRAVAHGITIYDASYIAIGDVKKSKVYTADDKLINKVGNDRILKHIKDYHGRL